MREFDSKNNEFIIAEGCFSHRNLNLPQDITLWIETDRNICKTRLNKREIRERPDIKPVIIRLATKQWQLSEDAYIKYFKPQ